MTLSLARSLLFDACQIGVVLRAIALVQATVGLAGLFGSTDLDDWLGRFALHTATALPALLAWLLLACALKRPLHRLHPPLQWSVGLALGLACGLMACALYQAIIAQPVQPLSWLASALAGVALAALLVNMLALRQRAQLPAETTARLAELQARIRPHFLFNTLNTAIALVGEDPAQAERVLEDLSDLFRHALRDGGRSQSTLGEEVQIARQYLGIEQIRFGERLRVAWSLDEDALTASVPPLLLQPLVENAIRHGIEPSPDGGTVHVLVRRKGTRVHVRISNSLPATPAAARSGGHGMALHNVRTRLRLLHDLETELQTRRRNGLFEVAFSLPVRPAPRSPKP